MCLDESWRLGGLNGYRPEVVMMKEGVAKLLLGEYMSGGGKGVCDGFTASSPPRKLFLKMIQYVIVAKWKRVASEKPFGSNDYMDVTPSWAVYGANEGGFDPDRHGLREKGIIDKNAD
ncbi:S-adenosyl-L-methionine-dependent tRNA 4-demethylwyosine synthase [Tanacetum coccineum]|uniref:S-adenosyl-L-methionine-dependent tRNA 4-demethylwyosine synthase n=1 Tax=Tanacetum coccineum TaxID=301880 RepID=A0ABQ5IHZ5_9ASTR